MREIGIIAQKMNERSGLSQSDGQAWKSAEYLIKIPAQYPREMLVNVFDKGSSSRIARFDALMGQMANIDFEIKAREYNGHWYNDLNAWNATAYVTTEPAKPAVAPPPPLSTGNGGFGPSDTGADGNNEPPF